MFFGYLILGILFGSVAAIVALISGQSLLMALAIYAGIGTVSALIATIVTVIAIRLRLFEQPKVVQVSSNYLSQPGR